MNRARALKILLLVLGLFFSATVYRLGMSLLREKQAEYGPMMLGIHAALGIFLLLA